MSKKKKGIEKVNIDEKKPDPYLKIIKNNDKNVKILFKEKSLFLNKLAEKLMNISNKREKTISKINEEKTTKIYDYENLKKEKTCVADLDIPEMIIESIDDNYEKRMQDEQDRYNKVISDTQTRNDEIRVSDDQKLRDINNEASEIIEGMNKKLVNLFNKYKENSSNLHNSQGNRQKIIDEYLTHYLLKEESFLKETVDGLEKELSLIEDFKGRRYIERQKEIKNLILSQKEMWKKNIQSERIYCDKDKQNTSSDIAEEYDNFREAYLNKAFELLYKREEVKERKTFDEEILLSEMHDKKKYKELLEIVHENKHIQNEEKIKIQKKIDTKLIDEKKKEREKLLFLMKENNEKQKDIYAQNSEKTVEMLDDVEKNEITINSIIEIEQMKYELRLEELQIELTIEEKEISVDRLILLKKNSIISKREIPNKVPSDIETELEEYDQSIVLLDELRKYQKNIINDMSDYAQSIKAEPLKKYFDDMLVSLDGDYYIVSDVITENHKKIIKSYEKNDFSVEELIGNYNNSFSFIEKVEQNIIDRINVYFDIINKSKVTDNEEKVAALSKEYVKKMNELEDQLTVGREENEKFCNLLNKKATDERNELIKNFNNYKNDFINIDKVIEKQKNLLISSLSKDFENFVTDMDQETSKMRAEHKELKQKIVEEKKTKREEYFKNMNIIKNKINKASAYYSKKGELTEYWWDKLEE